MKAREKHERRRARVATLGGGKVRAIYLDRDTEITLRALVRFYGGSVSGIVARALAFYADAAPMERSA